jgi:hypothetical protein
MRPGIPGTTRTKHHDQRARPSLELCLSQEQPKAQWESLEATRVVTRHPWQATEFGSMMVILFQMRTSTLLIKHNLKTGPRRLRSSMYRKQEREEARREHPRTSRTMITHPRQARGHENQLNVHSRKKESVPRVKHPLRTPKTRHRLLSRAADRSSSTSDSELSLYIGRWLRPLGDVTDITTGLVISKDKLR